MFRKAFFLSILRLRYCMHVELTTHLNNVPNIDASINRISQFVAKRLTSPLSVSMLLTVSILVSVASSYSRKYASSSSPSSSVAESLQVRRTDELHSPGGRSRAHSNSCRLVGMMNDVGMIIAGLPFAE